MGTTLHALMGICMGSSLMGMRSMQNPHTFSITFVFLETMTVAHFEKYSLEILCNTNFDLHSSFLVFIEF
jgi:hypothetical protein